MEEFYQVDIESFPGYPTTYIKMQPVNSNDNSSFYEVEFDRDEDLLAKFLRKLRPYLDMDTPMVSFKAFARKTLHQNINTCYCLPDNIKSIIELYQNSKSTPEKEYPGKDEGERAEVYHDLYPGAGEAFITENVHIGKDVYFQEKLIKSGSVVKLIYRGKIT